MMSDDLKVVLLLAAAVLIALPILGRWWRVRGDGNAMAVRIRLVHPRATAPMRSTDGAAGYDLRTFEPATIYPGGRLVINTGVAWEIPKGWVGLVWPRSGHAVNHGLDRLAGVIDPDYRDEVGAVLVNHGDSPVAFAPGDRVAQMVIVPCFIGDLIVSQWLTETERGAGAYGSTGNQ